MPTATYEIKKRRSAAAESAKSRAGRDIGLLPPVRNPHRRAQSQRSFGFFCREYFPKTFRWPWSDDHLLAIEEIETAALIGGCKALAMPRGTGKTSLCIAATEWASFFGHRKFSVAIGADEGKATKILESVKKDIQTNDALLEDFPEVVYPVRCLDNIANRCRGQHYNGRPTYISWTNSEIVLPTIAGSVASGAIIGVAGITGAIRGMNFKLVDGSTIRPDWVLVDDPQTAESARSPSQINQRLDTIRRDVLGLGGSEKRIAVVMPCTVIQSGDVADKLLDRDKNPAWQGTRTRLMVSWPKNDELWERYRKIRDDGLRAGDDGKAASEFYAANQAAMDEGAKAAWKERFYADIEASAIQHAMNLKYDRGDEAIAAEYQNEPIEQKQEAERLTADQIAAKVNRVPRGIVPAGHEVITAFIDVQQKVLFYAVCAWKMNFTGGAIAYGTYPDQKRAYFNKADIRHTLQEAAGVASEEAAIHAGLEALTTQLFSQKWIRETDKAEMRIGRLHVDAGYQTDLVYNFCRRSPHAANITPSHGHAVRAADKPWEHYSQREGERLGFHWRFPSVKESRAIRHVLVDVNFFKSFVQARLATPLAANGCLSLYGDKPDAHRLIADHLASEVPVKNTAKGRTVEEWKARPNQDNDLLDGIVGCTAAASIQGCSLIERAAQKVRRQYANVWYPE
ncbi:MAG TPA: terminase gpA endonuclease subunit [Tepidisphaeraceae bacterium]|jgi:hypothetical protein|nr:terminase gpA endonuclease subunit [Tepidisphaeraceae bacterium]